MCNLVKRIVVLCLLKMKILYAIHSIILSNKLVTSEVQWKV